MAQVVIYIGALILAGYVGYLIGNPLIAFPVGLALGIIAVMITSQIDNRKN